MDVQLSGDTIEVPLPDGEWNRVFRYSVQLSHTPGVPGRLRVQSWVGAEVRDCGHTKTNDDHPYLTLNPIVIMIAVSLDACSRVHVGMGDAYAIMPKLTTMHTSAQLC